LPQRDINNIIIFMQKRKLKHLIKTGISHDIMPIWQFRIMLIFDQK